MFEIAKPRGLVVVVGRGLGSLSHSMLRPRYNVLGRGRSSSARRVN